MEMFGEILRTQRQLRGLSIQALADRSGLSVGWIEALEDDAWVNPSQEVLVELADAMDIRYTDLLPQADRDRLFRQALVPTQPQPNPFLQGDPEKLQQFIDSISAAGY